MVALMCRIRKLLSRMWATERKPWRSLKQPCRQEKKVEMDQLIFVVWQKQTNLHQYQNHLNVCEKCLVLNKIRMTMQIVDKYGQSYHKTISTFVDKSIAHKQGRGTRISWQRKQSAKARYIPIWQMMIGSLDWNTDAMQHWIVCDSIIYKYIMYKEWNPIIAPYRSRAVNKIKFEKLDKRCMKYECLKHEWWEERLKIISMES